jgi:hypothetical protein
MGTPLVPSIENIEGCHLHGGEWDKKQEICYEKHPVILGEFYTKCTAPIKGVHLCRGMRTYYPSRGIGPEGNRINFIDKILAKTMDVVDSHRWFDESDASTRRTMDTLYQVIKDGTAVKCVNPRGKTVGCDQPNAIYAKDGSIITNIAHSYRNLMKNRPLMDITPMDYPKKYEKDFNTKRGPKQMEFATVDNIPALKDPDDELYHSSFDHLKSAKQRTLYGEYADYTKLHPTGLLNSVENAEQCFRWGGVWDKNNEMCWEKDNKYCTAPIKGARCCYGYNETECWKYDEKGNTIEKECYEPDVSCQLITGSEYDDYIYNTWDSGTFDDSNTYGNKWDGFRHPLEPDDAAEEAKEHLVEVAGDIGRGNASYWGLEYCMPDGTPVDEAHPNEDIDEIPEAIVCDNCSKLGGPDKWTRIKETPDGGIPIHRDQKSLKVKYHGKKK